MAVYLLNSDLEELSHCDASKYGQYCESSGTGRTKKYWISPKRKNEVEAYLDGTSSVLKAMVEFKGE